MVRVTLRLRRRSMSRIKLDAGPHPIEIDTAKTALIVVDMQNDFGSKGGFFDHAGIDIAPIHKVIPATGRAIRAARRAGIKGIYIKMGVKPDLSDPGSEDPPNRARHATSAWARPSWARP